MSANKPTDAAIFMVDPTPTAEEIRRLRSKADPKIILPRSDYDHHHA